MPGQSSVQTVLASGISSRPEVWSSALAPPMDTEDSLLLATGLPGCPYRFTLYSGPAFSDMNPALGLQLHHPRFLEFVGAPESARLLYLQLQSTCNGTRALCCPIFRYCRSS